MAYTLTNESDKILGNFELYDYQHFVDNFDNEQIIVARDGLAYCYADLENNVCSFDLQKIDFEVEQLKYCNLENEELENRLLAS